MEGPETISYIILFTSILKLLKKIYICINNAVIINISNPIKKLYELQMKLHIKLFLIFFIAIKYKTASINKIKISNNNTINQ